MRRGFEARRWAMAAVIAAATAVPGRAQAQAPDRPTSAMDDHWHFNVAPYFWMPAVQGDVGVANLPPVSVDASFSDIFENFDGGMLARFAARRNRFGVGADFVWMNLGAPAVDTELVDLSVDFRQFLAEGIGFYRVASGGRADNPAHLDVLAGVRYFTSRTRLRGETRNGATYDTPYQDLDWVDALAGVKFRAPLGSRLAILGRTDIAGFGSNLTWNLEGDLAFLASRHWTAGAGWRYMDVDYDGGEGIQSRKLDVAYNGPRVWFAYSW
jgi:hypothetical protein